jgi:hypothetical protein
MMKKVWGGLGGERQECMQEECLVPIISYGVDILLTQSSCAASHQSQRSSKSSKTSSQP